MAEITVTDRAAKYLDSLIDIAEQEKASIADALSTASDAKVSPIQDDDEFVNLCSVLGRYNRLLSLLS